MPTVSNFPNGQTLTSSALTENDVQIALQALALAALGVNPATDPNAYAKVRVAWVSQPNWGWSDDVCSLRARQADETMRDRKTLSASNAAQVILQDSFLRTWEAPFSLYGPNAVDRARLLASAITHDWAHDLVAASGLYFTTDPVSLVRVPEWFQGRWWQRVDLTLRFVERVVETLALDAIASAEVQLWTARGLAADIVA